MSLQTIIDSAVKEFDSIFGQFFKNVELHHYDMDKAIKSFLASSIKKAVKVAYKAIEVETELEIQKKVQEKAKEVVVFGRARVAGMVADKYTRIGRIEVLSLIEKKKSLFINKNI